MLKQRLSKLWSFQGQAENSDRQAPKIHDNMIVLLGSRDGTVVRALASLQYGRV